MRKTALTFISSAILLTSSAITASDIHWGYSGETGPKHWGDLDEKFTLCTKGKNQSPIDLKDFIEAELEAIEFNYDTNATEILNNGHTVQANITPGSSINADNTVFELKQFHFHSPSENLINGQSFPMEVHLVHSDTIGNLAVVAVMFEKGESNPALEKLWSSMPEKAGDKHALNDAINTMDLLPKDRDYFQFNGSLTTPPCTEGVRWLVMKQPVSVSTQQVKTFMNVMHHSNNRPVQVLNARPVLK